MKQLTARQADVLGVVLHNGPVSPTDVAYHLLISTGAARAQLATLESKGLVDATYTQTAGRGRGYTARRPDAQEALRLHDAPPGLQNVAPDSMVEPMKPPGNGPAGRNAREETVMAKGNTATKNAPAQDNDATGEFDTDLQAAAKAADLKSQGKRQVKPDPKGGSKGNGKDTAKATPAKAKATPKPKVEKPKPTAAELDEQIAACQAKREKHTKQFNAYRAADAARRVAVKKGESTTAADKAKDKARAGHNDYMKAYTRQRTLIKQRTELYGAPKK